MVELYKTNWIELGYRRGESLYIKNYGITETLKEIDIKQFFAPQDLINL